MKCVFQHQDLQLFCLKLNKYGYFLNNLNFHPLEVVARGSVPQLQAGENLNYLNYLI